MPSNSTVRESPLLARARRTQGWGLGLLAVAGLLWAWFAVLLVTPYDEDGDGYDCPALITSEYAHDGSCAEERDWPLIMALLGGSVPFAALGAGLTASGGSQRRLAEHLDTALRG